MALLRAHEAVMRKFLPALKQHGLTAQQWRVIRALVEAEELDISEIAERCSLLMPSLSRILPNLQDRKIIKRRAATDDQRRSMVSLTDKGRELFVALSPINEARYRHITDRFGYGKLELLYELLDELVQDLDEDKQGKLTP